MIEEFTPETLAYKQQLFSYNVTYSFQKLLQEKIGSEEVILTAICQFSKFPVTVPIRHSPINYIHCVFDVDAWLQYYQTHPQYQNNNGFSCPGCRKYTNFRDYGVDYAFYHILEELRLFQRRNSHLSLNDTQLIHLPSISNPQYFVETKVKKFTGNSKIKILPKRFQLAGASPILGVQRKQKQLNQQTPNFTEKRIADEVALTMVKLQQLINSKFYKFIKTNSMYSMDTLQQKVASKGEAMKQVFKNSLKLISIGKRSLRGDYVFALKKIERGKVIQSILIVYMINYGVWHEFPLTLRGNPYVQLEQALYIKGEGTNSQHQIFVIGGQKETRFQYSNQFLVICFPRSPLQDGEQAYIKELPSFPQDGYNFMGSIYRGNIYIFYGQKLVKSFNQQIQQQLYNTAYVFKRERWEKLNVELVPRIDGSFCTVTHRELDKLIIFFGGLPQDPDGLYNYRSKQQHQGQVFICREEKFFGTPKCEFTMRFSPLPQHDYQKAVLCTPVFSCPYYGYNQLILSGQYLKHRNVEQREIYTFDWANGELKMNELFSLEPPEQILTPYARSTNNRNEQEIFTPVQDTEGVISYGCFYCICSSEVESTDRQKKVITQLLKINLANGLFQLLPFQDHLQSINQAKEIIKQLEDRDNIIIP